MITLKTETEKELYFHACIENLRESCFHMSDEEATKQVDELISKHPNILNKYSREELIKLS